MTSPEDIISRLDDKIYALLEDTSNVTSYRLGDKQVSKTEALKALTETREKYQKIVDETPYEDIRHIAFDFDQFGVEETELIGDEN